MDFVLLAIVMLLALAAYWSMVIFPKQREYSKRQRFVRAMDEGQEVITAGGLIGRIKTIYAEDGLADVEIAEGVIVRTITASLLQEFDAEELRRNIRMAMPEDTDASAS